jgi:hypothetical protein
MNSEQIKKIQEKIKTNADGFWGPKSQASCRVYLHSLMPKNNPWPKSDQKSLRNFYGEPGDESNLVMINFPYPMYYGEKLVTKTRVHKKCADSLLRVLTDIKDLIPKNPDIKDEVEDFGGVYNFRMKRGGSTYSVHAWGAAIDLDADDNTFRDSWPMKSDMPLEIMEAFAREGWLSAGAFWGYDAMHFQATQ